jgi:hypothetical protein
VFWYYRFKISVRKLSTIATDCCKVIFFIDETLCCNRNLHLFKLSPWEISSLSTSTSGSRVANFCLQRGWFSSGISSKDTKCQKYKSRSKLVEMNLWGERQHTHGKITGPIKIVYQNSKLTQLYWKLKITEGNNLRRMDRDRLPH